MYDSPQVINHIAFGSIEFAAANRSQVHDYVVHRSKGHHPVTCFKRVFGIRQDLPICADYLEHNPVVVKLLDDRIKAIPTNELWNERRAAHALVSLANDPFAKCSTALAAMKELNVMFNITIVDENGKTRSARTLADFYKAQEQQASGVVGAGIAPKTEEDIAAADAEESASQAPSDTYSDASTEPKDASTASDASKPLGALARAASGGVQ